MSKKYEQIYGDWHWGNPATHTRDFDVPGLSENHPLVEAGLLTELHFDPVDGLNLHMIKTKSLHEEAARMGNEPAELAVIEVPLSDYNNNHLSFDPKHKYQRLYILLSKTSKRDAQKLWDALPTRSEIKLKALAKEIGGHHQHGYPNVTVKPLGILYYVSYFTHKKGDDPASKYIHRMGEEGGIEPALAVSADGNLWIVGGGYTCPNNGITH